MVTKPATPPWLVLTLVVTVNVAGFFSIATMPPLFAEMIADIELSRAHMGLLMGVIVLAACIFAPIGGMLGDRIGCRRAVGIGIAIAAVAGGVRAVVDTPYGLIACMFMVGVGMNILGPSLPKVLGQWFPPHKLAFANGVSMTGMALGSAVATATAASLLSPLLGGWRNLMVAMCIFYIFAAIVWVILYRDPVVENPEAAQQPEMFDGLKEAAKIKDLWFLGGLLCLQALGFMPVGTFLPISLTERGIAHAGELAAIIAAVAAVFNIIGGRISDRIGRRKPVLIFGTAVAGLCVLTYGNLSGIPLILMLIITGAGAGALGPVMFTIPIEMDSVGPEKAATAIGFLLMLQSASGFLGPIIAGKLIDVSGSYLAGFVFMGIAIALAALFVVPMQETGPKAAKYAIG